MLTVIYRITDIVSTNPSPVLQNDKVALNRLCLKSFVQAFSDIRPKVIFLADHMKDVSLFGDLCPFEFEVRRSFVGQNQTMLEAYKIAAELEGNVYFCEADYIYNGVVGELLDEAISRFGLVSPYDHPDFYHRYDIHPHETTLAILRNHHFRKSARNTMTWGIRTELVRKYKAILDKYGYLDDLVWKELKEQGVEMWTPIPSFATHLVLDLAPGVDWVKIWTSL